MNTTTLRVDLSGGRCGPAELTVKFDHWQDEDRYRNPVTDIAIESVMWAGVDIWELLTERQMEMIETAIRAEAERNRFEAMGDAA